MRQRRITRKSKRLQKGGSVRFLDAEALGYPDPAAIEHNMDLYAISCHGQTTDDHLFFVVPPNTYLMFIAPSGVVGKGNDPAMSPYVMYTGDKSTYYQKLYTLLFRPHAERTALGPVYEENLYIYEPGDIIPDYTLSFKNSTIFMFLHGLYHIPIASISGGNTPRELYLSKPLYYIKKALERGDLQEADLAELNKVDRERIGTLDDATLQKPSEGIPTTKDFRKTSLFQKIETLCCRGPENILTKPPFGVDELRERDYVYRLSDILHRVPKDGSKRDRFFLMGFCRVSYADIAQTYNPESSNPVIKIPRILRTLSFGAKCGFQKGHTAFNVFKIFNYFCNLPTETKGILLQHEPIRICIAILKKGSGIPSSVWKPCLEGTYSRLNTDDRAQLVSDMKGYFTLEDILTLSSLYTDLQSVVEELSEHPKVIEALLLFLAPFKTLYEQLQTQTEVFRQKFNEKNEIIEHIYAVMTAKFKPEIKLPQIDFLDLHSTDVIDLNRLREIVSGPSFNDDVKEIKEQYEDNFFSSSTEIIEMLKDLFSAFHGQKYSYYNAGPFPNVQNINTSISFNTIRDETNSPIHRNELLTREEKMKRKAEREERELENTLLALSDVKSSSLNARPNARKTRRRKARHI